MITVDAEQSIGDQHRQIRELFLRDSSGVVTWKRTLCRMACRRETWREGSRRSWCRSTASTLRRWLPRTARDCCRAEAASANWTRRHLSGSRSGDARRRAIRRAYLLLSTRRSRLRLRWEIRPALAAGRTWWGALFATAVRSTAPPDIRQLARQSVRLHHAAERLITSARRVGEGRLRRIRKRGGGQGQRPLARALVNQRDAHLRASPKAARAANGNAPVAPEPTMSPSAANVFSSRVPFRIGIVNAWSIGLAAAWICAYSAGFVLEHGSCPRRPP